MPEKSRGGFLETDLEVDDSAFVAPNAVVVGRVTIAADVSIWYHTVLRGDLEPISVGSRSNVQDGAVIHVDRDYPTRIGKDVTIGHGAIVHGAELADGCLVGMGAVVLSGARIGEGALVAAGALVPENFEVPSGALVAGTPARVLRQVDDALRARIREGCDIYVACAAAYRDGELGGGPRGGR